MGDPFTPPTSSLDTDLSWLFPQPPAKSSLVPRVVVWGEVLNDVAALKEQAIARRRIAAFVMIGISAVHSGTDGSAGTGY
mmetsp:Transcript_1082/g.1727  ORF Transcript_1082/g.1727 Transcript_1082/m.1727 type:complete len:80 (-) Transcript_1082:12-251(-)